MVGYVNEFNELQGVAMFHTKDHKTLNMFDPFEHLGPRRRKLLEGSWAHLFREEILPDLPVHKLIGIYSEFHGRPTKELYAMLGLMILQQMHDLTDDDAVDQFIFNKKWHYALNITGESDEEAYVSPRTLWSMRHILTEHDLYIPLFESVIDNMSHGVVHRAPGTAKQIGDTSPWKFFCPGGKEYSQSGRHAVFAGHPRHPFHVNNATRLTTNSARRIKQNDLDPPQRNVPKTAH